MRLLAGLAFGIFMLASAVEAQTVYRCVRPDGSVHLGDERPTGTCVEQSTLRFEPAPAPAAPAVPLPPPATAVPAPGPSAAPPPPAAPAPAASAAAPPAPAPWPTGKYLLWERRDGVGPWHDAGALATRETCQAERDRRTETTKNRLTDAVVDPPGTVKLRTDGREYVRYRCLPEGIRPA